MTKPVVEIVSYTDDLWVLIVDGIERAESRDKELLEKLKVYVEGINK